MTMFAPLEAKLRQGDAAGALRLWAALPRKHRDHPMALKLGGIAAYMAGETGKAVEALTKFVRVCPDDAAGWVNLGNALQRLGRLDGAVEAFRRAVAQEPSVPALRYNLGNALLEARDGVGAEAELRAAIALRPGHAPSHHGLSLALQARGDFAAALAAADQAIAANSAWAIGYLGRGNCLVSLGREAEAVAAFDRAVACSPRAVEVLASKAVGLFRLGRNEAGAAQMGHVLAMMGKSDAEKRAVAAALASVASVLVARRQFTNAAAACEQALDLTPADARLHVLLGRCHEELRHYDEALAAFQRAQALDSGLVEAEVSALLLKRKICDWGDFPAELLRLIELASGERMEILPFQMLPHATTAAQQWHCASNWVKSMARGEAFPVLPAGLYRRTQVLEVQIESSPVLEGRMRLGYLSGDFRLHPVGLMIPEVIERHDRERFDVFAYSLAPDDGSAIRHRLEGAFDRFVDLKTGSDQEMAARIRDDGIQILIDLSGATEAGRPGILAYNPAPIAVNFLGYPGSMGDGLAHYIIADAVLAPLDHQQWYGEKLVHMPDCYQPSDSVGRVIGPVPTREQCGLPPQGPVFCCFANPIKITPEIFAIWMEVLAAAPAAVLWLVDGNPWATANLRRMAQSHGMESRVVFAKAASIPEYLARLTLADLFLDTAPYSGGATVNDALWAGLPVLTCLGESYVGRMAASLNHAAGMPDMVAQSIAHYGELAVGLARDPGRLAALKLRLADIRSRPLFDMAGYTRALERAYMEMWKAQN